MSDQKIENLLNLALEATPEEREKSLNLDVGYNPLENRWDIIVKYNGSLRDLEAINISVVELYNEYAILSVPESLIESLAGLPQIEFIEKPKMLFFAVREGRGASCINYVQTGELSLSGREVLVAVIDSGIDYSHPDFRNADGTTRIVELWDQTIPGAPPEGYKIGTVYSGEQINEALAQSTVPGQRQIVPSTDTSGHGTHVAGIAAGNGRASGGFNRGVAPESELLIVKLGNPTGEFFPRTSELMQAVDYVVRRSIALEMPVAINLSFGNTYGSHDGSSLIETYLNDIANIWKTVICVGSGNEGAAAGHTSGILTEGNTETVELAVANYESILNVQIWKSYLDVADIRIINPAGLEAGPFQSFLGPQRFNMGNTQLLMYYGEPSPYSTAQEIYIDFIPRNTYIDSGVWRIELIPREIKSGNYNMWLPSASALNVGTQFLLPNPNLSLTIPSTAGRVITVGAYDARTDSYASFSGRGFVSPGLAIKPDLVAPGVNITSSSPGGGYTARSGTSMATPFVTGSAALLMQWGIVNGNDPFLYGEKVRAYLLRGTRPLPAERVYPNSMFGWGALCLRDSFPV